MLAKIKFLLHVYELTGEKIFKSEAKRLWVRYKQIYFELTKLDV